MGIVSGTLDLNLRGGTRLRVPAAVELITPYVLLEQDDWFEEEIRFLRRWLRPGMRAIDVGANYGVYAVPMARAVGSTGRLWAYEPTASTADLLEESLARNGCAWGEVVRAAVSDKAGPLGFVHGEHVEINSVAGAGAPAGEVLEVRAVTLDEQASARGWDSVDFLKIDVEGHEHAVLRGGSEFLRRASPLVMFEFVHRGAFDRRCLDVLAGLGYRAFRLLPGPLVLAPFDPLVPPDRFQLNLFACKDDRAQALAAEGRLVLDEAAPQSKAAAGAWADYARDAVYARGLASRWPKAPGWLAAEDRKRYAQGLAAFAASLRPEADAATQVARLGEALSCLADALQARPSTARRLSYARVAWALGWRGASADVLRSAIEAGVAIDDPAAEPFLAPSERHEARAGAESRDWVGCAAVEQYERLRDYSSFYSGPRTLEVLEPIRDSRYRAAETDRRRNLVRLRAGKTLEWSELLAAGTTDNLNPRYWTA